jgi:HTH-type transcriptional regulator/antitoxin MqsA
MSDLNGKTCPFCGEGHLNLSTQNKEYNYQSHILLIAQPGIYCDVCEEAILEPEHLKATRVDLQAFRARIDGILGPLEIKRIRKQIGLNQQQAGHLFGGGKNAFSRYEQGEISPPKAISMLLNILSKHPEIAKEVI